MAGISWRRAAWVVFASSILSGALLAPAASAGSVATHGLIRDLPHAYSSNWSGYAVTGGTYQSVSASWIEPKGKCTSKSTYSAFWVGLDGDGSNTVEQTGSEVDCSGGSPQYDAWYEMYPTVSIPFRNTVQPGDQFTASVTASGTEFTLKITDVTQNWHKSIVKSLSTARKASAEVIVEAPCCTSRGGVLPLADFGTVNITDAKVDGSAIGSLSPTKIDIGPSSSPKDQTSSLTGGDAFSVKWLR